MRRFMLDLMMVVVLAGNANAQVSGRRHRLYPPTFNGYGISPGLSVYENGFYSIDTFGGHSYRHFGYQPPQSGRRAGGYNGLYGVPNSSIFYYEGMHLTPYAIDSPIWSYGGW